MAKTVFRKPYGSFRYNAWPTIIKGENGVLYTVFSGYGVMHADPFAKNLLCRSYDNGETWSLPIIINDTPLDDRDTGICHLGGKRYLISYFNVAKEEMPNYLPLCYNLYEGDRYDYAITDAGVRLYETYTPEHPRYNPEMNQPGSYIRITEDDFVTISDPIKIPLTSPHGPKLMKDGHSIGHLGRLFDADFGGDTEKPDQVYFSKSIDGGKTFEILGKVPKCEDASLNIHFYCEPDFIDLGNNNLLGVIRCHSKNPDYRRTMVKTFSSDGGKTWSKPEPLWVSGLPPYVLQLKNGDILISYSKRETPFSIRGIISKDNGKTFGKEFVIDEVQDHTFIGDMGYPATAELDDGSLITAYYAIVENDNKPSICYKKWKLEEIVK